MSISNRLDEAMRAAGIPSQAGLARASGVPQPTINRILKGGGKRGPETDTLAKLAQACNVKLSWLLDGGGNSPKRAEAVAPPVKVTPKGGQVTPEVLAALGAISEREAQIISWFRMSTDTSKTIIETAARRVEKKQLSAVVDDQLQPGAARAGDRNRE